MLLEQNVRGAITLEWLPENIYSNLKVNRKIDIREFLTKQSINLNPFAKRRSLVYNNHQAISTVMHMYIYLWITWKIPKCKKSITNVIIILGQRKKAETDSREI